MRLLLDTCTFLWMVSNQARLSEACRVHLVDPANDVFLSAVSAWEICIKHKLGQLTLSEPPGQFLPKYRTMHGIDELALDELSVLQVPRLPEIHKDPFDRMIATQSILEDMPLLTKDSNIPKYGLTVIW